MSMTPGALDRRIKKLEEKVCEPTGKMRVLSARPYREGNEAERLLVLQEVEDRKAAMIASGEADAGDQFSTITTCIVRAPAARPTRTPEPASLSQGSPDTRAALIEQKSQLLMEFDQRRDAAEVERSKPSARAVRRADPSGVYPGQLGPRS